MTALRKRMIECLQLRSVAERTQEAYTRAVRQLAGHYHKSPDQISEAELRQYFLYLKNVKHYRSWPSAASGSRATTSKLSNVLQTRWMPRA